MSDHGSHSHGPVTRSGESADETLQHSIESGHGDHHAHGGLGKYLLVFLALCVPACYLSDRLLARARALNRKTSRFPMMALAAAASSACSFVVIGNAPKP